MMKLYLSTILASGLSIGVLGNANVGPGSSLAPPNTTKTVVIYNNSDLTIYPVITSPKRLGEKAADLWMQAKFGIASSDATTRTFNSSLVYRAYVNPPRGIDAGGVPPGGSVTVTVPFYTQLKRVNAADLGKVPDQFIDWWNAMRVYIFPDRNALEAALNTYDGNNKPKPVSAFGKSDTPTCRNGPNTRNRPVSFFCNVQILAHNIDPLANIPFELAEYTFADASGPPPNGNLPVGSPFSIKETNVNYDVSSLDSVYLPVAMGPVGNKTVPYVGAGLKVPAFNSEVEKFRVGPQGTTAKPNGWPSYVPVYFEQNKDAKFPPIFGQTCSLQPFKKQTAYLLPKLPGAFNFINESYKGFPQASVGPQCQDGVNGAGCIRPPVPPLLSSQPPDYASFPGYASDQCVSVGVMKYADPYTQLGVYGQQMVDLWKGCSEGTDKTDDETCKDISLVHKFFIDNFKTTCAREPDWVSTFAAVLGWVPVKAPLYNPTCEGGRLAGPDLAKPLPAYVEANKAYCRLQYNYLTVGDPKRIFNPYVELIHKKLASSAYAFSIDDKSAYKGVPGAGVIITIGGTDGLENKTPSPLPTAETIGDFCKGA